MNVNFRNFALWGLIALLLIALFQMFQSPSDQQKSSEIAYSSFLEAVDKKRVKSVTISGERITGAFTDSSSRFSTFAPYDPELVKRLQAQNVEITAKPATDGRSTFTGMLINWLPLLPLDWCLDIHHAPDAVWPRQSHGVRQIKSQVTDRSARAGDV